MHLGSSLVFSDSEIRWKVSANLPLKFLCGIEVGYQAFLDSLFHSWQNENVDVVFLRIQTILCGVEDNYS